jgi:HEAT repeat protein
VIWSRYSVILAFSLAAMLPTHLPRPAMTVPPAAAAYQTPTAGPTPGPPADAVARVQAACEIGRGTSASAADISALVGLLGDQTRVDAPECAGRWWGNGFGAEPAVCLTSPAQEAARALARIGRAAVGPLMSALADPTAAVRRHAAVAVGLIDDRAATAPAIPRLLQTLSDDDWQVRRNVVWALGESGDGSVVSPLAKVLADREPRVRATAAHALGDLDDVRAVDALIGALRDEHPEVREMAAWALGEIQQARAVPSLVGALGDADWRPRVKAAWALGEISSAEAVDGLTGALKDEHARVREMAAWALGEVGSAKAVDGLVAALKDSDWQVRAKAAWALGEVADRRAADPLAASMKDPHPQVRKMAAWALAEALGQ